MYISHFVIFLSQIIISFQKDISLHYPNRVGRDYDENDNSTINILAQIVSILVFVFYILVTFGLIKACLGLCCSPPIGDIGLDLLTENPPEEYHRNTVFCLNIVFFLVLPFVLFRSLCVSRNSCDSERLCAGSGNKKTKTEQNSKKDKKGKIDVYGDENDSENQDTKYVLEQLHRSEHTLRSGVFGYSTILEETK